MCANLFTTSYAIKYSKKKKRQKQKKSQPKRRKVSDQSLSVPSFVYLEVLPPQHSLLIDNFQAMTLILIQGCQDPNTIMQIVHHILDLHVLPGKGARSRLSRCCLVLQKVNGKRKTLNAILV